MSTVRRNFGEFQVTGLTHAYGGVPVLEDCSLEVPRGKLTVLVGPSGCGKTTLINILAGYEAPAGGRVLLDGQPVGGPGPDRLVVFQETALFPWMTVAQNVAFGCRVRGMPAGEMRERVQAVLVKVGLSDFQAKYPSQLSGGMQRRAELARAMVNDPKVLMLDEPFRGLDAMTRSIMQEFYVGLFEEVGRTNLFITHDLEEAVFLADRLLIMTYRPGRIKEVIEVDLPRPRTFQVMATQRYNDIRQHALELLFEEASKAFEAGSKAAFDLVDGLARAAGRQ